jgi:NNP family nitrate/nitrite transporter-like MFS transporter
MNNEIQSHSLTARPSHFPLGPILLVTGIFYLTFVSRAIMGPLLPVIEKDMGWGHGAAGSLFIYIAAGYSLGLLSVGYISSRLNYRHMITLAGIMVGLAMLGISYSTSVLTMHLGLVIAGISAGFYVPSGIATITDLASKEQWGKAMAVHELGPNLGYITAPLIAEGLIKFLPWRGVLGAIGIWSILMGAIFFLFGRGGNQKGAPPNLEFMRRVVQNPSFWIMVAVFTTSIGASIGVYSLMPLFLVSEAGFDRGWANTLIGLSRVCATIVLFSSGMIADRFGPQRAIIFFLATTGLFTLLMGYSQNSACTVVFAFLQASSGACIFPVAFTILSHIFPAQFRGAAVSLVFFISFPLAAGVIPLAIGHWAEAFSFSSGFCLLGLFFLLLLPLFLRGGSHFTISK